MRAENRLARMTGMAMRVRWIRLGLGALLLLAAATVRIQAQGGAQKEAQGFALKDGDAVVFYGDSITAQHLYTRYVEDFLLTRYPNLHIRFVNAGVPGDTVRGGYAGAMQERVQRDVAPFHPAMITVMLGMNDGGWGYGQGDIDAAFQQGYRALVAELRKAAPGAAFTLIGCTPYDEITHGTEFPAYSKTVAQNAADIAAIAAGMPAGDKSNFILADFHQPVSEALQRAQQQFPELAPLLIPDRIHPSETGHWIMAAALMSAWRVDPTVSQLELNAATAQVIRSSRTAVTNLEKRNGMLSWTQLDEALPLPFDFNHAMTRVLLGASEIEKVDRQILRVEALDAPRYQLAIDDMPIAQFTRDELRAGVNLALYKTPMLEQARGIDGSEEQRATLDEARFTLGVEMKDQPSLAGAEAALRQAADKIDVSMRKDLQPKPHHYELRQQ